MWFWRLNKGKETASSKAGDSLAATPKTTKDSIVTPELLAQIRRLHFQSLRLANETISGSYRSAFRGRGIEFEEVREYSDGDDVRAIDWKVTARASKPFVKSYREERELNVLIAVDVSASALSGTRQNLRDDIAAQVGAVLSLIGLRNNDKVGLVTFSDRVEHFSPPRKARSAAWRILHQVLSPGTYRPASDIASLLGFLQRVLKRRSVVFLISDFIAPPFFSELARLSQRHEVIAIWIRDPIDQLIPEIGLVNMRDIESGEEYQIDTSSAEVQRFYREASEEHEKTLRNGFIRCGIGTVELWTDKDALPALKQFFGKRNLKKPARRVGTLGI